MQPRLSIILPVYNVAPYLPQCLRALEKQVEKNIQIICVNDSSTDNSLDILNAFAARDKRFLVVSQKNQGSGVARNHGLTFAEGEFVCFVDPDDWPRLTYASSICNRLEETGAQALICNYKMYDDASARVYQLTSCAQDFMKNFGVDIDEVDSFCLRDLKRLNGIIWAPWNKGFRADFLRQCGARFGVGGIGVDQPFSVRALLAADRICYLDEYLYYYRIRKNSAVFGVKDKSAIVENMKLVQATLEEFGLYDTFYDEFRRYQFGHLVSNFCNTSAKSTALYLKKCREVLTPEELQAFMPYVHKKTEFLKDSK